MTPLQQQSSIGQGIDSEHPQPFENSDRKKYRHTEYPLSTLPLLRKVTFTSFLLPSMKNTKEKRFCPHTNDYSTLKKVKPNFCQRRFYD